ncbi:MAG: hypothetical protein ACOYMR_17465 [Ilumatobacteraceae bacterium]
MTIRTALGREIELQRSDIRRVEVSTIRVPFWLRTNFYFVGDNERCAQHYFVAYRTKALRASFESLGYAVTDV